MSELLTYNHIVLKNQRIENKKIMNRMSPYWSANDFNSLKELECFLKNTQLKIRDISEQSLRDVPLWDYFLSRVADVPAVYSWALTANVGQIDEFNNASELWSYCGMHNYKVDIESGKRWFKTKQMAIDFVTSVIKIKWDFKNLKAISSFHKELEERLKLCVWGPKYNCETIAAKTHPQKLVNWKVFLRTLCWEIGESIKEGHGFYHGLYIQMVSEKVDDFRGKAHNDSDIRIAENDSARRVTKLFLIHVVQYWRQLEGLAIKAPSDARKRCIEFPGIPIVYGGAMNSKTQKKNTS